MTIEIKVKLEQSQYDALCKSILGYAGKPFVDNNTSELQAGYQLGVLAVLNAIRDGFVYDRT